MEKLKRKNGSQAHILTQPQPHSGLSRPWGSPSFSFVLFFHSTSQILKIAHPQATPSLKSFFNTKYSWKLLWGTVAMAVPCGVMFYSHRDPPSPLASTELRLTQHQPLLVLWHLCPFQSQLELRDSTTNFNFWLVNTKRINITPPPFQGNHRLSSPLQLVLRGKPQINPKELEELTVPHLENKFSS